jgi:hypothetical protein
MSLRCGSFGSGHDVHYIQVIRVAPRHPGITIDVAHLATTWCVC